MKNKHVMMVDTFLKVIIGDKEEYAKVIPNSYQPSVKNIDYDKLLELGINNLIFDVDNTIAKVDDNYISEDIILLFAELKEKGFNIIVLSNNGDERVKPIAEKLDIKFLANAKKPSDEAFDNAIKILECQKENAVMIGDQMLSDIKGANNYGMYSILVDQLSKENNIQTLSAKVLQKVMVKKLKHKKLFVYGKYY